METKTDEEKMEDHEEIAKRFEVEAEAYTCKGDSYMCPHYERDTCLIHFKCCPEESWFACHKCHNEARDLVENLDEKGPENEEPSTDHSSDNYTRTTNISEEMEDSSSQAETSSEPEGLHNDALTGDKVEKNETVTGETSHKPGNTVEGSSEENTSVNETDLHDDPSTSEKVATTKTVADGTSDKQSNHEEGSSEEIASQVPLDATSLYPKKSKTGHSVATAVDGTLLKCKHCGEKQEFSQNCVSCSKSFATYFCCKCKLLIEKDVDPYHCDDCGICRGNKADHFHCDVCNICMALSLKENHKCFADRGHDPCAICLEEVFSGAIIFPCHHMIHEDCVEKLLLSGSESCPMCRGVIFREDEEAVIVEKTAQQTPSSEGSLNFVLRKVSGAVHYVINPVKRWCKSNGSSESETEMANVSNTRNARSRPV